MTHDLGKFLSFLTVSETLTWDDVGLDYIGESLDRNVKWYLLKYPWLESDDPRVNKIRNQGE